ncbi:MAG: hypothetical protein Alis3KO_07760 [Aliiglaciecola sp.]|uniref:hypothetical protein n=1 Tax=uncultured Pseudoalteromonas sp. TaxID=114053 RepID=UPI000C45BE80|nr:hypothetical protein [uncultured Pseudoalteromonas sp.]MBD57577.1 hypothetical protein [Pseudoalteromonas sp.]|tara:strand:- start:18807 stop:19205 length:399 start_codon:yes stop_codon:yes gene_type:complete
MSNKTENDQTPFIHLFTRKTRTPEHWDDRFRVCWYFDSDSLDYIYEHKNERFQTNGFVLSKGLVEQLPEELQSKFFEANERGLIFSVFGSIMQKYLAENVTDEELFSIFGISKKRCFSSEAYDEFEEMIDFF